jgi:hypothetical protein
MSATRTLADLQPGETARVDSFIYGAVRALCGDLGISEGDSVRCRAGTGGVLVLDTEDGNIVSMARDWARFITASPSDAPVPREAGPAPADATARRPLSAR